MSRYQSDAAVRGQVRKIAGVRAWIRRACSSPSSTYMKRWLADGAQSSAAFKLDGVFGEASARSGSDVNNGGRILHARQRRADEGIGRLKQVILHAGRRECGQIGASILLLNRTGLGVRRTHQFAHGLRSDGAFPKNRFAAADRSDERAAKL